MASLWPELTECTSQGCSVSRIWIMCVRSAMERALRSAWLMVPMTSAMLLTPEQGIRYSHNVSFIGTNNRVGGW